MRRTVLVARWLAPLGGGVLVALSLPPFGLWPLALCGVAILAWSLRGQPTVSRAAAGFLAGVGQFAIGLAWADKFTLLGYSGLVILHSAMFAVACVLVPGGPARAPATAGLLTLAEWARERWPFGGVPPGGIAFGQLGSPLVGTARVGGTVLLVGVTYLAGVSISELAACWFQRRGRHGVHDNGLIAGCLSLAVVVALAFLMLDFVFHAIGSLNIGFAALTFTVGSFLASPFVGILKTTSATHGNLFVWADVLAMAAYAVAAVIVSSVVARLSRNAARRAA